MASLRLLVRLTTCEKGGREILPQGLPRSGGLAQHEVEEGLGALERMG
jgi:hypothetical protein